MKKYFSKTFYNWHTIRDFIKKDSRSGLILLNYYEFLQRNNYGAWGVLISSTFYYSELYNEHVKVYLPLKNETLESPVYLTSLREEINSDKPITTADMKHGLVYW